MGAPESIRHARWLARRNRHRETDGGTARGAGPYSTELVVTLDVTNVIKGEANVRAGDLLQLYATLLPTAIVSYIDHLLFLNVLNRDQRVYYLTHNFLTVFANVDGPVVTPEYAAVKKVQGDRSVRSGWMGRSSTISWTASARGLDGTKADQEFLLRVYFAC